MRRPRLRFGVCRLMVAVAIVAFAIGIVRLRAMRQLSREKATRHAEARAEVMFASFPSFDPSFGPDLARYHEAMSEKQGRAARYPWLPVAPDPPTPK